MGAKRISAIMLGLICIIAGAWIWRLQATDKLDFPRRGQPASTFALSAEQIQQAPPEGAGSAEAFPAAWPLLMLGTGLLLLLAGVGGVLLGRRDRKPATKGTDPPKPRSN